MAGYYDDLFRLCGFEDEEIEKERPRIEKTFQKLEITPQDMKPAEKWVRDNHEVELVGVRKVLGVWMRELIDLIMAKEEGKKIAYFGFPSIGGLGMAIATASDNVYCGCPDVVLCHTVGQIFNKLNPLLEAGEQNGLPPGHGLCTLQAIRTGALAKGVIPVPDMVMMSSYYCDMGSKNDELLRERYGHPAVVIDGSMDSRWGEFPGYLPERVEFLGAGLDKLLSQTGEIMGVDVTREVWDKSIAVSGQLFAAIGELSQLMRADPMPISVAELEIARFLVTGSTGKAVSHGPEAIATLSQEVKKRVDEGLGVVEKGAPRIMVFLSPFSDASIAHMIEEAGLAVPVMLMTAPLRMEPWQTTYNTRGTVKAEVEMKVGIYHSTYALAQRWAEVVEDFNLDGSIWGYQFNCRPLAQPSHLLPKLVEERTGKPTLSLEMDYYDSRSYSAASLRTRVETFAEMLRARKVSAKV